MGWLRKLFVVGIMSLACWGLLAPAGAQAGTVDAVITADNAFNYFLGDGTGSNLRFIGGRNDWPNPLSFTGTVCQGGDYIYVAAWDQGGPQMFIGQYTLSSGGTLLTNTSDWLSYKSTNNQPSGAGPIATTQIQGDIAAATWAAPADLGPDGTGPWGNFGSIDNNARFIWHDGWIEGVDDTKYVLFRSKDVVCTAAPTPIPAALPLFGTGLVLLGAWQAGRRSL